MQFGFTEFITVSYVLDGRIVANNAFLMLFYGFISFYVCYNELKAPF